MLRKIGLVAIFVMAIATGFSLKAQAASIGTVTPWDGVNFRTGAGTNNSIIRALPQGTKLTIISQENGWANAKTSDGTTGWVCAQYISIEEVAETQENTIDWSLSDRSNATAERLVEFSKQFIGTKYVWGGAAPGGFDCSGFMYYIFGQFGYSLPRVAQAQYTVGYWVAKNELQKGDLVFFGSSAYNITHVGMYIGNDQFIHARSTGVPLSITTLSTYTNNYVGARRVLR